MVQIRIPLYSFVLLAVFATISQAQIWGIGHLGPDGLSTLYQINPRNGKALTIGPIGFERCGGMDFDPDGVLFATCERTDGIDTAVLVNINTLTGIGTEVGPTGINSSIGDISFRNSDGVLFAYDGFSDPEHTIYIINTLTGQAELVGDTGFSDASGNGMTFTQSDNLVQSPSRGGIPMLYQINQVTGQSSFMKELAVINAPPPLVNYRLSGLDIVPGSGQIYGILNDSRGNQGQFGPMYLATLDIQAGVITVIGQTADGMDAIAFRSEAAPIPTLSGIGSVVLAFVLLSTLVWVFKRNKNIRV